MSDLPMPSERNFEVYDAVILRGLPIRKMAERAGVSPSRVREICTQVGRWINAQQPDDVELAPQDQLRAAFCQYQRRIDYFYQQSMACWRGEIATDVPRVDKPAQPKYLMVAMRLAREQYLASVVWAKTRTSLKQSETAPLLEDAASPPVGVCAPEADAPPVTEMKPALPVAVSASEATVCVSPAKAIVDSPREKRVSSDPARRRQLEREHQRDRLRQAVAAQLCAT